MAYTTSCQSSEVEGRLKDDIENLEKLALAGVAQWIKCRPAKQGIAGSIPSQGTSLGCEPGSRWGTHERQPHIDVFLPPVPSL